MPINNIMGCEVVSVYADQLPGKMGYSRSIMKDLVKRDFRKSREVASLQKLRLQIQYIYGFTQSQVTGQLFSTKFAEKQYMVYSAGRFIVVQEVKKKVQRFITNKDAVSSFTVTGKLCLTGIVGGGLYLWDLQYLEAKLQIMLPEGSENVSTVGLSAKYLFATDCSQPHCNVFCYDLRTGKLKAHTKAMTQEPALKSLTISDQKYSYICADGLWFFKFQEKYNSIEVVKGMFGKYPKTSMTCLQKIGGYIISGGVDGYVYLWRISDYQCCKAWKVNQTPISAFAVVNKTLIIGFGGRVKIYSMEIKQKQREDTAQNKYDLEQEIITFIMLDSYEHEGTIFAIAVSLFEPLIYYLQTRQGSFQRKILPSATSEQKKVFNRQFGSEIVQQINCSGKMRVYDNKIYSCYKVQSRLLNVDVMSITNGGVQLVELRWATAIFDVSKYDIGYLPSACQLVYVSKDLKLYVCETFNKRGDALQNANFSNISISNSFIVQLQNQQKPLSVDFTFTVTPLLCLTSQKRIRVFSRVQKLKYEQKYRLQWQKDMPIEIQAQQTKLIFESSANQWRDSSQKWRSTSKQQKLKYEGVHCCQINSKDSIWEQQRVSCGGGVLIIWR